MTDHDGRHGHVHTSEGVHCQPAADDVSAAFAHHDAQRPTIAQEAGHAVSCAVVRNARETGTEIRSRKPWPDSCFEAQYPEPAAGIRIALALKSAAAQQVRDAVKYAREEGLTWVQIGEALRLAEVAEERGAWIADLAFDYVIGNVSRWETPSFAWRCFTCGELIIDRGPSGGHLEDDEPGHKEGCARLAGQVAEWKRRNAEWDDEPERAGFDPGPEVDDEGGMSEYRHPLPPEPDWPEPQIGGADVELWS
jgi:hypothetical protein